MARLSFQLEARASGSRARAARFKTLRSEVITPVFMPVGTMGTVRGQTQEGLLEIGAEVLLANTYHLLLRPGTEVFKKMGGLHRLMNWPRSILTDSGGFQIFCLPHSRKMSDEGAKFKSYVDGTEILLSPEKSIQTQQAIGSDIMMVLDQCIPSTAGFDEAKAAMDLTHRWARRSLVARGESPQSMFGILQGACHEVLRRESASVLTEMPFDGYAIGGLAVGETKAQREDFCELSASLLPEHLPRYLMGVGTPIDLLEAVHRGVDMFDCILPTALAQQGVAFTSQGRIDLQRGVYKFADEKLDPDCKCKACLNYSRAYLHHLIKSREVYGWHLVGFHNLTFYHRLMAEMRSHILTDTFSKFYQQMRPRLSMRDEANPVAPKKSNASKNASSPSRLGDYCVLQTDGGYRIQQVSSHEVMHSINDPSVEARSLYVEQSHLQALLSEPGPDLVLWDVGLGAAYNAMAALQVCIDLGNEQKRKLVIESFERDLDPLRLVLQDPIHFLHVRHGAPHAILEKKHWTSAGGRVDWRLYEGDFLETLKQALAPDIIFFDPFSFKVDAPLWSESCFATILAHAGRKPFELFTYSNSTAVRAALLAAGLFVAQGRATGPKSETTIAVHPEGRGAFRAQVNGRRWLGPEWLGRWQRSDAQFPREATSQEARDRISRKIMDHPQFRC